MNIVFFYINEILPEKGGIQRVTTVLADYFEAKGLNVYYLSLLRDKDSSVNSNRQYFLPYPNEIEKNIPFFIDFLNSKNIDILINQSGTRPDFSSLAYVARTINVNVVSVVHNSILSSIKNFSSLYKSVFGKYNLAWILPLSNIFVIKQFLLFLYRQKYQSHYKELCIRSNKVILLSNKFREELKYITANTPINNVLTIPNPVSFYSDTINLDDKKHELLYVGRIDTLYKRVDLLLEIWSKLYDKFPDWELKIVGGGNDYESIVNMSKKLKLKRIYFEGYQDPKPYYLNASIFCMTSSSESFGLVLLEAMQFCTVPVAFNSYLSVTDIIDHQYNGLLITPFDCDEYANELSLLMRNKQVRESMALAAKKKSMDFSVAKIGEKWLNLFEDLIA